MEIVKLTWQCELCGDIVVSYSNKRHDMNYCKCGESAVDLEEWYQRNMGKIKEIKRETIKDA
ncbi:MAG: hypothetical protein U9O59_01860 [Actinomycetota bacterium]|nr:hypothetical protein [Actinomycetota bacterium]